MKHLAPTHWPPRERTGFCYLPAGSKDKCKMKEGIYLYTLSKNLIDINNRTEIYSLIKFTDCVKMLCQSNLSISKFKLRILAVHC